MAVAKEQLGIAVPVYGPERVEAIRSRFWLACLPVMHACLRLPCTYGRAAGPRCRRGPARAGRSAPHTTFSARSGNPSMCATITSPFTTAPTFSGVPL